MDRDRVDGFQSEPFQGKASSVAVWSFAHFKGLHRMRKLKGRRPARRPMQQSECEGLRLSRQGWSNQNGEEDCLSESCCKVSRLPGFGDEGEKEAKVMLRFLHKEWKKIVAMAGQG